MAAVAADDDEVTADLVRNALNFAFRSAEDQVLTISGYFQAACEFAEMRFCLFLDLLLHRRQIHRHVTAVGKAQRFYDVHQVEFCA